jgi:hypothetical protein
LTADNMIDTPILPRASRPALVSLQFQPSISRTKNYALELSQQRFTAVGDSEGRRTPDHRSHYGNVVMTHPYRKTAVAFLLLISTVLPLTRHVADHPPSAIPVAAYLFVSANTAEDLTLDQARQALHSPRQHHARRLAEDILRQVGAAEHQIEDALGDWSDGIENSLVVQLSGRAEPATVGYAAAWFGLLHEQKSVLYFVTVPGGPDLLHEVDVPEGTVEQLRRALDEHDIRYRTLVSRPARACVLVFDEGGKLRPNVRRFAAAAQAGVRERTGRGRFVGEETRQRARDRFRQEIRDHERDAQRPRYAPPVRTDSAGRFLLAVLAGVREDSVAAPGTANGEGDTLSRRSASEYPSWARN